jgi:hypothetical protein
MDGFLECVKRMVLTPIKCRKISKQMKIYRLAVGTFGYDMAVQDRSTRMLGKLQFVSNFNALPFYLLVTSWKYNLNLFSLLLFFVDVWWTNYGKRVQDL